MKKAAIMAAGDSTRMMPLSANLPKHLLPIAGKPLIFHTLDAFREAGIEEALIIYGYQGEKLKAAVDAQDWGKMSVHYIEQTERRGTSHAAGHAREFAGDDDILLLNGDVIAGSEVIGDVIRYHKKGAYDLTVSVFPVDNPSVYGIFEIENGRAVNLVEKPTPEQTSSNLANAGFYAVNRNLWDAIDKTEVSKRNEYELTDSVEIIMKNDNTGGYVIESWWVDIGKPWDLLDANKHVLDDMSTMIEGVVESNATLKGTVVVREGALVKNGAYIEGPVYIGKDSVVGPNCLVRAHSAFSRKVKIGNAVEIKNSIIMDGTNVGHLSYVGDSILGHKVNFGAGTITANLRHDNRDIKMTVKGKRISSGRRKLGTIVGDDVKTGIGTSISTGVVLHQGSKTGPGVIVDRDIQPYKLVMAEQPKKILDLDDET
jgi:bifunctional UDP-N-acetylglucosamine pyrophosphorylase/glucosamine-1-phosphate N-acetyltransferase